jgi:hypothetical protein
VSAAVSTLDANTALADRLRAFGAKLLSRRVGTSHRTTEKWVAGDAGPTWKHVQIMLNDDELCRELLIAAGRADIADAHAMLAKLREAKKALDGVEL